MTLTADEVAAVARGQFVRPESGSPPPADHYRLRDGAGELVAIASAGGGRLAPEKVFVAPAAARTGPPVAEPAMDVVTGIDALERSHGPIVVVGVFDGMHRGHPWLLEHLADGPAPDPPGRAVITFDHHPDEVLTGRAPALLLDPEERLSLGGGRRRVDRGPALRRGPPETPYDAFVERIRARVELRGFS